MIPAGGGRSPMSPGCMAAGRWAGGAETERGGRVAGDRDAAEREGGQTPLPRPPPGWGAIPLPQRSWRLSWRKACP